jgi:hypothetical protein
MQPSEGTSTSASMTGQTGSRHSRRSRSSYRHDSRARRYRHLLAGVSLTFLVIYVLTWFHFTGKTTEHEHTLLELRKLEKALTETGKEVETLRKEKAELVKSRIPGLLPLTFDQTIGIDNPYIRNIIFTEVKNGKEKTYEYRLVMNNDTLSVIHPQVQILLFNDIGIQIGEAEVELRDPSTGKVHTVLDPGEVRTQTALIKLLRDEKPQYFLLSVSESAAPSTATLRDEVGGIVSH